MLASPLAPVLRLPIDSAWPPWTVPSQRAACAASPARSGTARDEEFVCLTLQAESARPMFASTISTIHEELEQEIRTDRVGGRSNTEERKTDGYIVRDRGSKRKKR